MRIRLVSAIALALAGAGCSPDPTTPAAAPPAATPGPVTPVAIGAPADPTSLPPARWDSRPAGSEWTRLALSGIDAHGQGLLAAVPSDIGLYCPRYAQASQADRRAFWVGLMSALARFESNFDPSVTFTEPNIIDAQGNRVISRGLLQVSRESANGYGCAIADEQQLHNPATNLACAARIMNRLVTRDGVVGSTASPWKGMAAYWSPFRRADRRAEMQQWTSVQAYCR